jgi:hypothetical protein
MAIPVSTEPKPVPFAVTVDPALPTAGVIANEALTLTCTAGDTIPVAVSLMVTL